MLLADTLLRSIIRFGEEDEEHLSSNLYMVRQEVSPPSVDGAIIEFIGDIYDRTKRVCPSSVIKTYFEERQNEAALQRLSALIDPLDSGKPIKLLFGPEFRYELDQFKKKMSTQLVGTTLMEASQILTSGLKKGNQTFQGPDAALAYLSTSIAVTHSALKRGSVEGSFRRDHAQVKKAYEFWRDNQDQTVGVLSGIDKVDVVHRGLRNGELALVLGFTSHLKTTFCINWFYKAAVWFGRNVAIASLETPVEDLRMSIYVMHSGHQKWADQGFQPLDFERVTAGILTPEEERFLDMVIDDLGNNPDYGDMFYKEPEASLTINEIQRWAESKHKTTPLDLLVIDYLGLVDSHQGQSSIDSMANLNKVIRQSKILAISFGQGRGIPVVSPFQANREGLKDATNNGGRYKLTALAGANEAERSSDKVYYVYLDDTLRNARELAGGNIKSRRGPVILEQYKMFANPATRVIDNLDTSGAAAADLVTI